MSYNANDFPLQLVQNFPVRANLSSFDDIFANVQVYLANVANMAAGAAAMGNVTLKVNSNSNAAISTPNLNFVNTNTILITLQAGANAELGNANISFDVVGGAGSQGATGAQGIAGTTGAQGIAGINGIQGTTGIQGPFGIQGTNGAQGIQGIEGPAAPLSVVAETKLLLHFDEADGANGNVVIDSEGNYNSWVQVNNVIISSSNTLFGNNLLCPANGYIYAPINPLLVNTVYQTVNSWYIECQVYPRDPNTTQQVIWAYGSIPANPYLDGIRLYISSGYYVVQTSGSWGNLPDLSSPTPIVVGNTWTHVAVGWDAANSLYNLYVGGSLRDSFNVASSNAISYMTQLANGNVTIGGDSLSLIQHDLFNGNIDEFRITYGQIPAYTGSTYVIPSLPFTSGAALVGAQGAQGPIGSGTQGAQGSTGSQGVGGGSYYAGDSTVTSLMHFEGANNANSYTQDAYFGYFSPTLKGQYGATLSNVQSKFGNTSFFSNTFGYLYYPNTTLYQPSNTDFTLEFWTYLTSYGYGGYLDYGGAFVDTRSTGSATDGYLIITSTSGNIRLYSGALLVGTSNTISLNNWHHVAITQTAGIINFWLDGIKDASSYSNGYNWSANNPIVIGTTIDHMGSATLSMVNSYIDDFRVTRGLARYTTNFTPTGPFTNPNPTGAQGAQGTSGAGSSLYVVSGLPSATLGARAMVTDANNKNWGTIVYGGGSNSNVVPVYADGSNWYIG